MRQGMRRRTFLLAALPLWGRDLSGVENWVAADGSEFPYSSWKVEGGVFQTIGGLSTFQDIKTREVYRDFEFSFEFKLLEGGNSGVKYCLEKSDRWQPKGAAGFHIRARGLEFQLIDDKGHPDAQKGAVKQCGALYNAVGTLKAAVVKLGDFNSAKLVHKGLEIEHWINGECLVRHKIEAGQNRDSSVSLQNHANDVWFRGLSINSL